MYLRVPSHTHTREPGKPTLTKKQDKLAGLMLVFLAAPARFCALSDAVSHHEKNPKPSIKPRMGRSTLGPPLPGGGSQKPSEKLSQVLCETFQRDTIHARKKILTTKPALQVQRTRTDNF